MNIPDNAQEQKDVDFYLTYLSQCVKDGVLSEEEADKILMSPNRSEEVQKLIDIADAYWDAKRESYDEEQREYKERYTNNE